MRPPGFNYKLDISCLSGPIELEQCDNASPPNCKSLYLRPGAANRCPLGRPPGTVSVFSNLPPTLSAVGSLWSAMFA
jgi:hypothetical protein